MCEILWDEFYSPFFPISFVVRSFTRILFVRCNLSHQVPPRFQKILHLDTKVVNGGCWFVCWKWDLRWHLIYLLMPPLILKSVGFGSFGWSLKGESPNGQRKLDHWSTTHNFLLHKLSSTKNNLKMKLSAFTLLAVVGSAAANKPSLTVSLF